jgi:hypothetical protein
MFLCSQRLQEQSAVVFVRLALNLLMLLVVDAAFPPMSAPDIRELTISEFLERHGTPDPRTDASVRATIRRH